MDGGDGRALVIGEEGAVEVAKVMSWSSVRSAGRSFLKINLHEKGIRAIAKDHGQGLHWGKERMKPNRFWLPAIFISVVTCGNVDLFNQFSRTLDFLINMQFLR